jgi:hypothetical protein
VLKPGQWRDSLNEVVDGEPASKDPSRPFRRLATAIILSATIDLLRSQNPQIRGNAEHFLFPKDPGMREHFNRTVQASGIDRLWLTERLSRVQDSACPFNRAQVRRAKYS